MWFNPIIIYKSLLYLQQAGAVGSEADEVFKRIEEYFKEFRVQHPPKTKYKMQYHIFLKLQEICKERGLTVQNEATVDRYELLFADIVVREKSLIIEVDGP